MCTDARQYAMQQQQAGLQQPVYHHQQLPPQMQQQYQQQPTYQAQPQYVITQAQAAQLQERPRQNGPIDPSLPPNIYHQQMGPGLPQNVLYHQQVSEMWKLFYSNLVDVEKV